MIWRPTSRRQVSRRRLVIDRVTASRMGITPQAIDQLLYDAFGQRQVSTLYTQVNQYHVVLETATRVSEESHPSCRISMFVPRWLLAHSPRFFQYGHGSTTASGGSTATATPRASPSTSTSSGSANPSPVATLNGGAIPLSAFTRFETKGVLYPSITRDSFRLSPFRSTWRPMRRLEKPPRPLTRRSRKLECR